MDRVVVVGAGVVGLCCAYSLRRRGIEVIVIDRASPGSGASHGNGGWICPAYSDPLPAPGLLTTSLQWLLRPESPLYVRPRPDPDFMRFLWQFQKACNQRTFRHGLASLAALNRRTIHLYDRLAADGVEFEMHSTGLLCLFRTERAAAATERHFSLMEEFGYPAARRMDVPELRLDGVDVADGVIGGLLAPAERHVRPETLVDGLARWLEKMGASVRSGERVIGLDRRNGVATAVRTTRDTIVASHVVLAAGVWSRQLAASIGTRLPLEAGKGYAVTMAAPTATMSRPISCTEAHLGISPYEGALRVLGTMELSGLNTYLNPRRLRALKEAPRKYLRGWTVANVREEWTGMRPLTPDGLPIIGPAPTADNVVIAAGHAMLGVTLAPATGEAVADIITGEVDSEALAPFRAERF